MILHMKDGLANKATLPYKEVGQIKVRISETLLTEVTARKETVSQDMNFKENNQIV